MMFKELIKVWYYAFETHTAIVLLINREYATLLRHGYSNLVTSQYNMRMKCMLDQNYTMKR